MKKILVVAFLAITTITACNKTNGSTTGQAAGRVVYVNTDSLLSNYDFYKDVQKKFEQKGFELDNQMQKKAKSFQNEVALFQKRIQAGGMSQQQAETTQAQLQKKEQDIMLFRDNAANALAEEQANTTDSLLTKIQDYLKKFNSSDRYDMVIGYSKGGGVLYAKEDLDITAEVIKGLNSEYSGKEVVKEEVTADSTEVKK